MTLDDLVNQAREAGHFAQIRSWGHLHGVELAGDQDEDGHGFAPLIKVIRDDRGRWLLTVFGEVFFQVPEEKDLLSAALEQIRGDECMTFADATISKYNLIEIQAAELRAHR